MVNKSSKIRYRKAFSKYGDNFKSLAWITKEAQDVRFRELVKDIDFEGKTVLDVGCGFGDVIPVILARTDNFEYVGVDIVPEFVKVAQEAYKNRSKSKDMASVKFLVRDYIKNPLRQKFDVVLCSGSLNSQPKADRPLDEIVSDALRHRQRAIKVMWDHTREVLAFNMAGGYPQPNNKKTNRVFYANSMEILKFCFTLTSKIIFRHNYRKRDFTILMFR